MIAGAVGGAYAAMFAGGLLLLERSDASRMHLDVEHALFETPASLIWRDASGWASPLDPAALAGLPAEVLRMALALLVVATFVFLFRQPIALSAIGKGFA